MKALLHKSCKDCTASSIETYFWTIKSLAKIAGLQDVPTNERWITAALLQKVKQQKPLTRSKNLAVAGIKALRAYGNKTKLEPWNKYVTEVSERYSKIREKQERTDREAKNWPKGGYAAISKLADMFANCSGAGEGDKAWNVVRDDSIANLATCADDYVEQAFWQACLFKDLGE